VPSLYSNCGSINVIFGTTPSRKVLVIYLSWLDKLVTTPYDGVCGNIFVRGEPVNIYNNYQTF
jgi:hypothetical protein